jgi:hypothetical protein
LKNRTGAPYGDAILAGVSAGIFKDLLTIGRYEARYASRQSRIAYIVYRIAQYASRTTGLVNGI